MPVLNSSAENSHWVAALHFHASNNTNREPGSRCKSSNSRTTPSIPILSGSEWSEKKQTFLYRLLYSGRGGWGGCYRTQKCNYKFGTYLYICCTMFLIFFCQPKLLWSPGNIALDWQNSYRVLCPASSHVVQGKKGLSSLQFVSNLQTPSPVPFAPVERICCSDAAWKMDWNSSQNEIWLFLYHRNVKFKTHKQTIWAMWRLGH